MTDKKISELTVQSPANSTSIIPVAFGGANYYVTAQAVADLGSGAVTKYALTKADDTNVTLTLGGNPSSALVDSVSITAGWTGTLSSTRQPATTVNSVANDTNVTGTIGTQKLTLGWTGVLAAPRGGTNLSAYAKGDLIAAVNATTLDKLTASTDGLVLTLDAATTTGLKWAAGGSGSPGGSDTQIQYNASGSFAGDSGLTFNSTSNALTVTAASNVGNVAFQVLPSAGASFTKIADNGTVVIDADSGTGTFPLTVKYNGTTLMSMGFSGTLAVGATAATGGIVVGAGMAVLDGHGWMELAESTTPAAPGANAGRIFVVDSGGKSVLKVLFASGAAQVIATEP